MDDLMSSGSLGGGSFAAKGAEKLMDKKVGKDTCCPSLSFRMRLIGFGVCFILGAFMGLIAVASLMGVPDITHFIVAYTFGFTLAMCGTFFLIGPKKQCGMMFDEKRRITTMILFSAIILTIIVAFALDGFFATILLLILVLVQFGALFWYLVLIVPYGKKMVCGCFKACLKKDKE